MAAMKDTSKSLMKNVISEVKEGSVLSLTKDSEVDEELARYVCKYKRRYPQKEVQCTDKDRAAAMGMGSEDVKDRKETKRKTDSSAEDLKRKEFAIHTALVRKNLSENQPRRALYSANRALELQAKDKRTLIARSKCYLYLGENEKALEDIEAALVGHENDTEVLYQKAQVLYMMGDFEFASVFFQRGMQLRPQLKKFQNGLQKAQYAIQNALGGNTRIKLSSHQIDRLRDKHQQAVKIRKFKDMAMGGKMKKPGTSTGFDISPTPSMVQHVTDKLKKTEESQLLGLVSKDKMYCKELIGNRNLYPVDNGYGQRMAQLADSVVHFLGVRQEFWLQQKPVNLTRTRRETVRKVQLQRSKTGGIVDNLPSILKRVEDQVAYLNKGSPQPRTKGSQLPNSSSAFLPTIGRTKTIPKHSRRESGWVLAVRRLAGSSR